MSDDGTHMAGFSGLNIEIGYEYLDTKWLIDSLRCVSQREPSKDVNVR